VFDITRLFRVCLFDVLMFDNPSTLAPRKRSERGREGYDSITHDSIFLSECDVPWTTHLNEIIHFTYPPGVY
jgi:hypothetical protein